jgi:endonuclease/exonuclease/phosphatase family metal-dependent hydrolase
MKLVTWNIQWGRGIDGRVDLDRTVRSARALADFDLLCLQEVAVHFPGLPGSRCENQVARLGQLLPGFSIDFGAATDILDSDGKRSSFGNVIASRLPVLQVFRHLLPWPAESGQSSMQRIAIEAVVASPLGSIRVTTTHLEYYSATQRGAQVRALRSLHESACSHSALSRPSGEGPFVAVQRPSAAIICGDFNCAPDSTEHRSILAPFAPATPSLRDAWRVAHANTPHAPTVGLFENSFADTAACFDFAFVTDDLAQRIVEVRVDPLTQASDHQPLLIEFA